ELFHFRRVASPTPTPTRTIIIVSFCSALRAAGGEIAEAVLSQKFAERRDFVPVRAAAAVAIRLLFDWAMSVLSACARGEYCLQEGVQIE
ncbi:hypothetical protein NL526_27595, partial [Klebsiella pneumoniae]|nr:hypothetical protein [Klebsiella pneumoniae]